MSQRQRSQRKKSKNLFTRKLSESELNQISLRDSRSTGSQDRSVVLTTWEIATSISNRVFISQFLTEFHMTVESKVTNLSNRQASMLLAIAVKRALSEGVDFQLYLTMEFLFSFLWRNGTDPIEEADEKVRKTLLLSDIIFSYIRGRWLTFTEREEIPESIKEEIESLGWLPNDRTYESWKNHWKLEKYLKIRTVPVDLFRHRNKYQAAERYSGYTKGYGNDGTPAHPGRTRKSRELDGEVSDELLPSLSLQEFDEYQTAIRLIEFAKAHRAQKK